METQEEANCDGGTCELVRANTHVPHSMQKGTPCSQEQQQGKSFGADFRLAVAFTASRPALPPGGARVACSSRAKRAVKMGLQPATWAAWALHARL